MATTYDRIRLILEQAARRSTWQSPSALATELRQRKLSAFRMRGDGSTIDHYMREDSVQGLVRLCIDMGLINQSAQGVLTLSARSTTALNSEDAFARQIRSSVLSLLENHFLPLEAIRAIIAGIELPDVPDANTIYDRAQSRTPKSDLSADLLRRVLFLLYHAEGLNREIKVYYGSES